MRVTILVFSSKEVGWGHWYRSIALAEYIRGEGHQVTLITDRKQNTFAAHLVPYADQTLWRSPLAQPSDWLVIDLPDEAPDWLYRHCRNNGVKTLVLNGVGHQTGDRADLRIIQGLDDGPYSGVDYIILRRSVFEMKSVRRGIVEWFVFGGAADRLGLTAAFPDWQRISFIISDSDWQSGDIHDEGFLMAASQCRRACVAMGMTAWELAAIGIPTYVFSLTDLHLSFALKMAEAGYIKAWPDTGRPTKDKMIGFLAKPFIPKGKPIDGLACHRIMSLMIDRLD